MKKPQDNEDDDYSLSAFFLTFVYYFAKRDYVTGISFLITTVVLPKSLYFVVGLIAGFFVGKGKIKSKNISASGILISCLSLLVFCGLKYLRYMLVGSI